MQNKVLTSVRFMVLWILGNMAALYATLFVGVLAIIASVIIVAIAALTPSVPTATVAAVLVLAAFAFIGAMMGLITGSIQKGVLRQRYRARFDGWVLASVIGGALGMLITAIIIGEPIRQSIANLTLPKREAFIFYGALPAVVPLAGLGALQTVVLLRYAKAAWLWLLANVVSGLVLFALLLSLTSGGLVLWVLLIGVSAAPAIVTGFALLWLLTFNARSHWPD
jgi:hypothetical protein